MKTAATAIAALAALLGGIYVGVFGYGKTRIHAPAAIALRSAKQPVVAPVVRRPGRGRHRSEARRPVRGRADHQIPSSTPYKGPPQYERVTRVGTSLPVRQYELERERLGRGTERQTEVEKGE